MILLSIFSFLSSVTPPLRAASSGSLVVSFAWSPSSPQVGQVVTFNATVSGGTPPYSFNWDLGDGTSLAGNGVAHMYVLDGIFIVKVTVTDFSGISSTAQKPVVVGSWNPRVDCAPTTVRITDITDNMTGPASLTNSAFYPGTTSPVGTAKRWLTPGSTPPGWVSPGPPCTTTNSHGTAPLFVELDGVGRSYTASEDCATAYDTVNGGAPNGGTCAGGSGSNCGSYCDFALNAYDPLIVPSYFSSCTSASDPTCYGRIHMEIDHDWRAAGYCGPSTVCDNSTIDTQTTVSTRLDVQGFVYWDPNHLSEQSHEFSGWEIHPLTAWRVHRPPVTVTFSSSPSTPASGQTVTFTATGSGGQSPYAFTWDLGDGSIATGNPVSHTYKSGSYNIHLASKDSAGTVGVSAQTLAVSSGPDYTIAANPTSINVLPGSSKTSSITATSLDGFSGDISLSLQTPAAFTALLNHSAITVSSGGVASSVLTVSTSTSTPTGSYLVTVIGTNGSLVHSVTVGVSVTGDFSISAQPTSMILIVGSSGKSTITLGSIDTFSGAVGLTASVLPNDANGPKASFNSANVNVGSGGSASSELTVSTSTSTPGGNYTVTVTGASGSFLHSVNVTVAVPVPNFAVTVSPTVMTVAQGSATTVAGTGTSIYGFTGAVSLSDQVYPAGLTVSLGSTSLLVSPGHPGNTALTVSAGPSTPFGNYTVVVTGSSGVLVRSANFTVSVPRPDFKIGANPLLLTVQIGQNSQLQIAVMSLGGFQGTVSFDLSLSSPGLAVSMEHPSVALSTGQSQNDNLRISANSTTPAGVYLVSVKGTSGLLVHSLNVTVTVPPSSFGLTANPSLLTVQLGQNTQSQIVVTSLEGFQGKVFLTASASSPGLAISIEHPTVTLSPGQSQNDNLRVSANSTTPIGVYIVSVNAVSGLIVHSLIVTVTVPPVGFSLAADHSLLTVQLGQNGQSQIVVTSLEGFQGTVSFSVSVSSPGLAVSMEHSTVTLSGGQTQNDNLRISATNTSPTGVYIVMVTASSGLLVHSLNVTVRVPDFSMTASQAVLSVARGSTGSVQVLFQSLYGFQGGINTQVSVSPGGPQVTLNPNNPSLQASGSTSSILSVQVPSNLAPGVYNVTIRATAGPLTHVLVVSIIVT